MLGSVSAHAIVALAVARGAPHRAPSASPKATPVVGVVALELELELELEAQAAKAPAAQTATASAPARHHHDSPVPADHDAKAHDPAAVHVSPPVPALNSPLTAAPTVVDSPAPAALRFVMSVGPSVRAADRASLETGTAPALGQSAKAEPAGESSVDTPAKLLAGSSPSYTREAEAAGVEADVPLEIVIDAAGSVISARALAHVGYGLDEAALRSVRGYRFSPARRGAKALSVRMNWLMRFQLR